MGKDSGFKSAAWFQAKTKVFEIVSSAHIVTPPGTLGVLKPRLPPSVVQIQPLPKKEF